MVNKKALIFKLFWKLRVFDFLLVAVEGRTVVREEHIIR